MLVGTRMLIAHAWPHDHAALRHLGAAEARGLLAHDDIGGDAALAVGGACQRDQRRLVRHKVLHRKGETNSAKDYFE